MPQSWFGHAPSHLTLRERGAGSGQPRVVLKPDAARSLSSEGTSRVSHDGW